MASSFARSVNRIAISSLRSIGTRTAGGRPFAFPAGASAPSPLRRLRSLSRMPAELGSCGSLLPLHSAVAAARLTSRLSATSRSSCALSQGILCRTYPGL